MAQEDKAEQNGRKSNEKSSKANHEEGTQQPAPPTRSAWPGVLAAVVIVTFVTVVVFIIFVPGGSVWTDDAYVAAHYTTIAPQVSGQIVRVLVTDNQTVRQGQLLALIDDRSYNASVAQAEAAVEADQGQEANAAAAVARQPSLICEARAQLASAEAQLAFARTNDFRYHNAAATGADTYQDRQQADTSLQQSLASVAGDQASLAAEIQQEPQLAAQLTSARADVASAEAQLTQARLNRSYTRLVAPLDGMVGELTVQVGNYVGAGDALMAVIPLQQLYITANYREVALQHVVPGDHVRIHVDAYDVNMDGVVNSIPPASGAAFEPIQPNNATGNFTKIVQRLPLKIVLVPGQLSANLLRVGMSVETTIDTASRPHAAN